MFRALVLPLVWFVALSPFGFAQSPLLQKTDFDVILTTDLDTATAKIGDQVVAQVDSPDEFKGEYLYGAVTESKSGGKVKGSSVLTFRFTDLTYHGKKIAVSTSLKQVTNSKGAPDVDEEGRAIKKKNHIGGMIGATAAGALVGGLIGGGKGAAIGAAAGAAGSIVAIEMTAKGSQFKLSSGSHLLVEVSPGRKTKT